MNYLLPSFWVVIRFGYLRFQNEIDEGNNQNIKYLYVKLHETI